MTSSNVPRDVTGKSRSRLPWLVAGTVLLAALAIVVFPIATPVLDVRIRATREEVLSRARVLATEFAIATTGTRSAIRFASADTLKTYLELEAGGKDTIEGYLRRQDVPPLYSWEVRFFEPGSAREATLSFDADGRLVAVERQLDQADRRPELNTDAARQLAERTLSQWLGRTMNRYRLVSNARTVVTQSNRVEQTFVWERTDRRVAGAPIRLTVRIAGDLPIRLHERVEVPQRFLRRYAEMRSSNELLALLAVIVVPVFAIGGLVALLRYSRAALVRWRPAIILGSAFGVLTLGASINELPAAWFDYETHTSSSLFVVQHVLGGVVGAFFGAAMLVLLVAAAEVLTRRAFPDHLDWWKHWRYRATRQVAERVAGGYLLAAFGLAYVSLFYLVTRRAFGWWVPSDTLDNPNLIATPLPWLPAITLSLEAGVLEEALFRAIPLGLISLWASARPEQRRWALPAGVVLTALVFGFAHADYPSWPPYSRGVELFAESVLWAVVYLRAGLPTTIIAHFAYDMVWFGLFALAGDALPYRVTLGAVSLALLAPALAVFLGARRGLTEAPPDARMRAWVPSLRSTEAASQAIALSPMSLVARRLAFAAITLSLIVLVAAPATDVLGPRFTADAARARAVADSLLRTRGAGTGWRTLIDADQSSHPREWRFLRQHDLEPLAKALATSYLPVAFWTVRHVHTEGRLERRAEEWRTRLLPDARVLDVRHVVPDDVAGRSPSPIEGRAIVRAALLRDRLWSDSLREVSYEEIQRPHRRDARVTFVDSRVHLPAGATARVSVTLAGDREVETRRFVELPEAFIRRDRAKEEVATLITFVIAFLLGGVGIVALALLLRRSAPAIDDRWGSSWIRFVIVVAAALQLASALNGWPEQLAGYDTAVTWTTFQQRAAIGIVAAPLLALFVAVVCRVADATRRRVGIPIRAPRELESREHDVVLGGVALGVLVPALVTLLSWARQRTELATPSTNLDALLPVLSGVLEAPTAVVLIAATACVPPLLLARYTRNWWQRVGVIAIVAAAPVAAGWSSGDVTLWSYPAIIAALLVVAWAVVAWVSRSALSWIVAGASAIAWSGVRSALAGGAMPDRLSAALGAVTAIACALFVLRVAGRDTEGRGDVAMPALRFETDSPSSSQ
jgi:membrane protease YdiL (CAAX protease family)